MVHLVLFHLKFLQWYYSQERNDSFHFAGFQHVFQLHLHSLRITVHYGIHSSDTTSKRYRENRTNFIKIEREREREKEEKRKKKAMVTKGIETARFVPVSQHKDFAAKYFATCGKIVTIFAVSARKEMKRGIEKERYAHEVEQ